MLVYCLYNHPDISFGFNVGCVPSFKVWSFLFIRDFPILVTLHFSGWKLNTCTTAIYQTILVVHVYVSVPRLIISYMHICDRSEHVTSYFHSHFFAIYYFTHCFLPSIKDVIHLLKLYRYLVFSKLVYQSEMRYLIERLHKVAIYSAHSSTFIQNFRPFILYLQKL